MKVWDLYPAFRRRLRELAPRGRRYLLACSGGPDSMALWDLLERWRAEGGGTYRVAHVDHGLRGRASRADADFVRSRARRLGTPCRVVRVPVRDWRRRHGGGLEETARLLRYRALAAAARRTRCREVLTAHHQDDQVETVFLNLIRGAGPAGLSGMAPAATWPVGGASSPRLLRPLLGFSRAQLMAYNKRRAISYRIDASNRDAGFLRNRLRPILRGWERLRPGFFTRVSRLAEILRDEEAFWEPRLRRLERAVLRRKGRDRLIALRPFIRYHKAEQRRLLRRLFPGADFAFLDRLRAFALASDQGTLSLRSGAAASLERSPGLRSAPAVAPAGRTGSDGRPRGAVPRGSPVDAALSVPGRLRLPASGGGPRWIVARPVRKLPARWRRLAPGRVFVDADRLDGPGLRCRTWRPGDRFQPLGMTGHKKLQDFFTDARVPREQRDGALVIENAGGIVWVVGHRLADPVKLTPSSRRIVELSCL